MNVTIRKIGNSVGIILPKEVLNQFGASEGDTLTIEAGADGFYLRQQKDELARQIEAARVGMQKYKTALRELAK